MEFNPIGKEFQAPLSPLNEPHYSHTQTSGQQLFQHASDFYAWYLAWDTIPNQHALTFQYLSQIKRIAQISQDGGSYLTHLEEQRALEGLSGLRKGLYYGNIKQGEIPGCLAQIMHELTMTNHKARLVARITELEYILCIHPPSHQSQEMTQVFRDLLNHIISQISPNLLDMDANAIDQGMAQIIKNLQSLADVKQAIHQAIQGWL